MKFTILNSINKIFIMLIEKFELFGRHKDRNSK